MVTVTGWGDTQSYNLLVNGVYWGEITHLLTIDPNFLGHPNTAPHDKKQRHSTVGSLALFHVAEFFPLPERSRFYIKCPRFDPLIFEGLEFTLLGYSWLPGTPRPTIYKWQRFNWMMVPKSLHRKWLEITISIYL